MDKRCNYGKITNYMNKKASAKTPRYSLNKDNQFVIENYHLAKPFANFFPGIAGKYGIPMWVFYVNRAQAISCFGIKDKEHAILEYFPANKAWQMVSSNGFRTFIKIRSGNKESFYEPFQNNLVNTSLDIENKMLLDATTLSIIETNHTLGLETKVEYFGIPNDSYAGLARIVTLKNIKKQPVRLHILDGVPQILPFGTSEFCQKKMSRTIEAWMRAENLDKKVPFFKLTVDSTDKPEVIPIKEGHFYLGFTRGAKNAQIIKPIVNPDTIFGEVLDFSFPNLFVKQKIFRAPKTEILKSKTPCAFLPLELSLKPGEEKTFYTIVGYMRSRELLNSALSRLTQKNYLAHKKFENKKLIADIQQDICTSSGVREFDLYAAQTYLDNCVRGGYPTLFESQNNKSVFYLYSRKHGDLERDYNNFILQPTYFSQGNGNYRDANQNRRSDIWFNPGIAEENLVLFYNLIQTDGFNPLVVKGVNFVLADEVNLAWKLKDHVNAKDLSRIITFCARPFSPGELIMHLEEEKITMDFSYDTFLGAVISCCSKIQEAEHGDGYWSDHWTYALDLLESYLNLYPEHYREIVFEKKKFSFFDNTEVVHARSEKYVLKAGIPAQAHTLYPDSTKRDLIRKRTTQPHVVRSQNGHGEIYYTTLINKLLCLLANKLASLDSSGVGIEMETDKPNWFDALNGLPGLFGSSINETFELKRLILTIKKAAGDNRIEKLSVTEEIKDFLLGLGELLKQNTSSESDFIYWDKSTTLKEEYRQKTKLGVNGKEAEISAAELASTLELALNKINRGLHKALDQKKNIYCSYFINEVTKYSVTKTPAIKPTEFNQKKIAPFLEGQMHALRLAESAEEAKTLYEATRKSNLYDKKLKMYKVTESLKDMPLEIGRCTVFPSGWLENESVFLHMEYKYLLEILKQGLFEEFYSDFKNALIPFQKPAQYGRSILENSSFIVSSAFADKKLHGNGFSARLSGSTAEFIQMWLVMNLGKKPFYLDKENKLTLQLQPALAGWLFDKKGNYRFNFLGSIKVTYHNPKRKSTFGSKAALIEKICFHDKDGKNVELPCCVIPSPYAEQVRSRQIKEINVYFA